MAADLVVIRHCKFCGRAHQPVEQFKGIQKLCRNRLEPTALTSLTPYKAPDSSLPSVATGLASNVPLVKVKEEPSGIFYFYVPFSLCLFAVPSDFRI